jgi:hypothetical protein
MSKDDRSWVTIELRGNDSSYSIVQKYTIKDFTIQNPDILKAIENWHNDVLGMHARDRELYAKLAAEHYHKQREPIIAAELEEARQRLAATGGIDGLSAVTNEPKPVERKEVFDESSFELASA